MTDPLRKQFTDGSEPTSPDELLRQPMIHMHPLINTETTCITIRDLLRFVRHTGHPLLCLPFDASGAVPAAECCATQPLDKATT